MPKNLLLRVAIVVVVVGVVVVVVVRNIFVSCTRTVLLLGNGRCQRTYHLGGGGGRQ